MLIARIPFLDRKLGGWIESWGAGSKVGELDRKLGSGAARKGEGWYRSGEARIAISVTARIEIAVDKQSPVGTQSGRLRENVIRLNPRRESPSLRKLTAVTKALQMASFEESGPTCSLIPVTRFVTDRSRQSAKSQ